MIHPHNTIGGTDIGAGFNNYLIVKSVTRNTAVNGKDYLKTLLGDATGEVTAMIWNVELDDSVEDAFQEGNVVRVEARMSEYQGMKQLDIRSHFKADPRTVDMAALIKAANINTESAYEEIENAIGKMTNPVIRDITSQIAGYHKEPLKSAPAAMRIHHAYHGGLIEHTTGMLHHADALTQLYPGVNSDLLNAGVILHDIGKIYDYEGVTAIQMTKQGKLKGHISTISEMIDRVARHLDYNPNTNEEVLLLQHMVLSHHGNTEQGWGSSVSPRIIEAEMLHMIDRLDARINQYSEAAKEVEDGEFTKPIFGLERKEFYKHNLDR